MAYFGVKPWKTCGLTLVGAGVVGAGVVGPGAGAVGPGTGIVVETGVRGSGV
jgi:hypothetical protein